MFAASKTASSGVAPDAQFNYVTMLLHGDGTNGAQNNTFLDSSTNNFTITRNGNTTQGSFSPYGAVGNWSTAFSGSSQNLYTPSTTALNVGSGNFTIECFFNVSAFNGGNILRGGNQYNFALLLSGTSVVYYLSSNGSSWDLAGGSTAGSGLTAGTWCHLALVRSGNTFTPYVNGVAGTTTTSSSALAVLNGFNIGAEQNGSAGGTFNGYISNVRVVVGTAVYTSNFTPPTSALTAVSGTQLLACQNNRFIDNSSNNFTFTTAGTPSVQRFNPFGTSTAYSTSVIGGSGYFDGSGDYLTGTGSSNLAFGSGDFTIELWVYFNSVASSPAYQFLYSSADATVYLNTPVIYWFQSSSSLRFNNGSDVFSIAGIQAKTWYHVAVSRSSTTTKMFLNGVQVGSATDATVYINQPSRPMIGANGNGSGSEPFNGYISDVRCVKGTAVYTAAFTPPTAPLTAISNTQLLLNMTNGAIYDNAMMNDLETVGNAQISTSVVKYGTGSLAFDGTGDWLSTTALPNLVLGGADFTLECWVYISSYTSYGMFFGQWNNAATQNWVFRQYSTTGRLMLTVVTNLGQIDITSTNAIGTGSWVHVAATRSGSSFRLFINGTQDGSATSTGIVNSTSDYFSVGGTGGSNSDTMTGYIDDLRITKGYARYTGNFTPPTAAFPNTGPI